MSLTSILREECPNCHKLAVEVSRIKIGASTIIKLQCGHILSTGSLKTNLYDELVSSDGFRPRPYQIDGIKFLENADANAILADEQGLGKTVMASLLLRLHREKLLPAIIACPTTVKTQWFHEVNRWMGKLVSIQVIQNGKEIAIPGMDIYIVTYDILKKASIFDMVDDIKTIIIDECQRIKNHLSDRAKAVQDIVRDKKIQHVIPMSGTPIKNHAGEYFTVLNLVNRRRFPHYQRYIDDFCDSYSNGWGNKIGGIKDIEKFKSATEDIVLRRTKSEVLPDLPSLERKFYHVELDRKLNKAYAKALEELDDALYDDSVTEFERSSNTIAIMSKLRHITGLSKLEECIEFTTEFLLSSDRKIVIFAHHKDVADLLGQKINAWLEDGGYSKCLMLHSGLDGDQRATLVNDFKTGTNRVMIASTLAAGEGINLQFCSDAVLLERQWTPPDEEQVEGRFHRFGQLNSVSVTYMIASGTIDEYFTELVESKRAIISAALDGKEIQWDQSSLMKDLAQALVSRGRERWKM